MWVKLAGALMTACASTRTRSVNKQEIANCLFIVMIAVASHFLDSIFLSKYHDERARCKVTSVPIELLGTRWWRIQLFVCSLLPFPPSVAIYTFPSGRNKGLRFRLSTAWCHTWYTRRVCRNYVTKKHRQQFVQCCEGVVYKIPLSCGRYYVGQTGRCANDRMREHANKVSKQARDSQLSIHCYDCGCQPFFRFYIPVKITR
uniref:Tick transposon n=1 Tax=Rhipicephalus zambeziensis TaxID=60191 RepID=A0A224Z9Z8_9ACAR